MQIQIRNAEEKDYPFILRTNEENVEVLSPMDENRIQEFSAWSELFLVAEVDGIPTAFLLALREGSTEQYDQSIFAGSKNRGIS
ncbi:MAG: hypothetical protein IJA25_08545 [Anaerotignum sp.]|nr:hypothetical protein [Anaerotignum sp.]